MAVHAREDNPMKSILFFLLGAAAGAYGMYVYNGRESYTGDIVSERLDEWHLTPGDVRADLQTTGQVVRARARAASETINDLRIVGTIKAKFVLDRDLSATEIHVRSKDGQVTLEGTVSGPALVGKATALALDTEGVSNVTAQLTVQSK
jgi:osmotically-inducible protein OsmY